MTTLRTGLLLVAATTFLTLTTPTVASAAFRAGFNTSSLAANDDGSTGAIAMGFTANYFGTSYTDTFVNNNGNVTFINPLGIFTPFGLTTNVGTPIIAAFFADVDTRGVGSALTKYGTGLVNGRNAFGVTWDGVGYFSLGVNKLNAFQLVLVSRADIAAGDFDIEFNYNSIQWETGGASGGTNGLGGNSARVGYSAGTGAAGSFAELAGSGVNGAFLNGGPNSLISNSLNSNGVSGRYIFNVRNGVVLPPPPVVGVATPAPAGLLIGVLGGAGLFGFRRFRKA